MSAAVLHAQARPISRVVIDAQPGEAIEFAGTGIRVEVVAKSGRSARLCVTAPKTVRIDRCANHQAEK